MQTVKELIEELQKYPQDFKVMGVARHPSGGFWCPVEFEVAIDIATINTVDSDLQFKIPLLHIILDYCKHKPKIVI